jgi:Tol biopolymer transport system component
VVLLSRAIGSEDSTADFQRFTPFATDAGYQGESAWSPEGKTLAFLKQEAPPLEDATLWMVSLPDGEPRRYSPVGFRQSSLVGACGFRLMESRCWPGSGPQAHLADVFPRRQWLAFQRAGRLWISSISGGTPVRASLEETYQDAPTWSPDGEWIAYGPQACLGSTLRT